MRVSFFTKVTAMLAMGLGTTTSIDMADGAPSTDYQADKTAMAQIGSWATHSSSLVSEYESSLTQTETSAQMKYKKNLSPENTKQFFAFLHALCKIVGKESYVTNKANAKLLINSRAFKDVMWKVSVIDSEYK